MSHIKNFPKIYAIAGGPASGKTSFIATSISNGTLPAHAFLHDCDFTMQNLTGYKEQLKLEGSVKAFNTWELPSRELAEKQLFEHVVNREDIIYDRSCALPGSLAFIKNLVVEHGYKLIMHAMYVDPKQAAFRALQREALTQRHIPENIINTRTKDFAALWPEYLNLATEAYLYDSSDFTRKLIASYKNKLLLIHEPIQYEKLINKEVFNA